ncbi:hypothetical protein DAPPUDRAFT_233200 [Daphnia pulex]|uniref:Uncharacterized protein n=1 Tax=Daphnia pulex TaxID=6669 RepID=E9FTH8_DAPPU|nr:hypothetical protein DAPPUDRAFT_233200 [Daphnia pulex]|eukprot:EFX89363.1 hypothetical protein DAPPUDRAFT_233200 [Daphnia pulex]
MAALNGLRDGRVCGLGARPGLASTLGTLTSRFSQATILNRKLVDDRTTPQSNSTNNISSTILPFYSLALDKRKPWSALWSIFLPSRRSHLRRKKEELRNSKIKDQITSRRHTCVRKLIEQDLVGGKKSDCSTEIFCIKKEQPPNTQSRHIYFHSRSEEEFPGSIQQRTTRSPGIARAPAHSSPPTTDDGGRVVEP